MRGQTRGRIWGRERADQPSHLLQDLVEVRLDVVEVAVDGEEDARRVPLELRRARRDRRGVGREARRPLQLRVAADELGRRAEAEERDGVLADEGPRVAHLRELREEHARRALLARQKLLGRARRLAHPALAALKPQLALLRLQQDDPRFGDAGLAAQLGDPRAARLRLHLGERRVQRLQRLDFARRAVDRPRGLRDAPAQRRAPLLREGAGAQHALRPLEHREEPPDHASARARRRLPARRHANFPGAGGPALAAEFPRRASPCRAAAAAGRQAGDAGPRAGRDDGGGGRRGGARRRR